MNTAVMLVTAYIIEKMSPFFFPMWLQEGAFAQLKLWQSVSIAVVFFISTSISFQTMVVVMLVALCISVVGFLFLTLKVEKAFTRCASWGRIFFKKKKKLYQNCDLGKFQCVSISLPNVCKHAYILRLCMFIIVHNNDAPKIVLAF